MTAPAEPPSRWGKKTKDAAIDIRRIEIVNVCLVVVAALAAFFLRSEASALGVVLGGAIMATSFRIIVAVMQAVLGRGSKRLWPIVAFWLKFAVMMILLGVLVIVYDIDAFGLLIGLSTILVSIVLESIRKLKLR
jgi:hypothetical protein